VKSGEICSGLSWPVSTCAAYAGRLLSYVVCRGNTCRYCKKSGHTKEECGQYFKYVNSKRSGDSTMHQLKMQKQLFSVDSRLRFRRIPSGKSQNSLSLINRNIFNYTVRRKIEEDHLQCQDPQTITTHIKFLINSGDDLT